MENTTIKKEHKRSKVLIIGASGFLGKELYKTFKSDEVYQTYGTYSKKNGENFEYLGMTDLESIKNVFSKVEPNIVLITAALTNVENCETSKEEAYKINVIGIKNVIQECKAHKCKVIYISTEYVFDGNNGPYDELDEVNPINYYGETKLYGEKIILEEIEHYLIVRTTVVYGWDIESKNFIMQLIKNLNEKNTMKVTIDQISSPTYCPNLAEMIKECCEKSITGILNIVGRDIMDRYTFAIKAAEILNLNKNLIIPIETKTVGQIAKRPLKAGLNVDKISQILECKPMSVVKGLNEVKKLYMDFKAKEL